MGCRLLLELGGLLFTFLGHRLPLRREGTVVDRNARAQRTPKQKLRRRTAVCARCVARLKESAVQLGVVQAAGGCRRQDQILNRLYTSLGDPVGARVVWQRRVVRHSPPPQETAQCSRRELASAVANGRSGNISQGWDGMAREQNGDSTRAGQGGLQRPIASGAVSWGGWDEFEAM